MRVVQRQDLHDAIRELDFLQRLAQEAATAQKAGELVELIIRETTSAMGTDVCSLYLSEPDGVQLKLAATNGHFPGDYDIARAIAQMWKKVGIDAELDVIEYAKYFELNRATKLPEATLYSWDNATGDPEIFAGYLLNPKMPFSAWKGAEVGDKVQELFNIADYRKRIAGYRELNRFAVEAGATIPLLQSVQTLARKKNLTYASYANGWILASTMALG